MRYTTTAVVVVLVAVVMMSSSTVNGWRQALWQFDGDVQARVKAMTLEQKIGQMGQMSFNSLYNKRTADAVMIDEVAFNASLDKYFIGSMFDSPAGGGYSFNPALLNHIDLTMWRKIISRMQEIALARGSKQPILFALDLVHGAHYLYRATIFPQQINLAATFNRTHAREMGEVTARNARAIGVRWTFSPIADLALQPSWARVFEQLGEDPFLASQMIAETVYGLQGQPKNLMDKTKIAACMKHFIGYGNPRNGHDQDSAWISDRYLYMYFLPAFEAAVKAGVETTMEDYVDINGEPVAASKKYLIDLLRDYLGFDGVLVTDWQEIRQLYNAHHVASSPKEAVQMAFTQTSIDMDMVPVDNIFNDAMLELVNERTVSSDRIDASTARIVQLKKDLGLFESPFPPPENDIAVTSFGSDADEAKSLQTARESLVLVKNDNGLLPLKTSQKVLLVGPGCDSRTIQTGGWTIHWQGAHDESEFWSGSTLLNAIKTLFASVTVTYHQVFSFNPEAGNSDMVYLNEADLDEAIKDAAQADVIVTCIGEQHYAEKPGDIDTLELFPIEQLVLRRLNATGKPIVELLIEGRPRVLNGTAALVNSIVYAMLPGPHGGQAMAELLFGAYSPSGRMPISYPKAVSNTLNPYWRNFMCNDNYRPEWKFGTGLHYTTIKYANLRLSNKVMKENQTITVSVDVTNTGSVATAHSVLVFTQQTYRIISPEVRLLKAFDKIFLRPAETKTVELPLRTEQFSFWGLENERRWQNGVIQVFVGAEDDPYALWTNFTLTLANVLDVKANAGIHTKSAATGVKEGTDNTLSSSGIAGICIAGGVFILLGLCYSLIRDKTQKYPSISDNRNILVNSATGGKLSPPHRQFQENAGP